MIIKRSCQKGVQDESFSSVATILSISVNKNQSRNTLMLLSLACNFFHLT